MFVMIMVMLFHSIEIMTSDRISHGFSIGPYPEPISGPYFSGLLTNELRKFDIFNAGSTTRVWLFSPSDLS